MMKRNKYFASNLMEEEEEHKRIKIKLAGTLNFCCWATSNLDDWDCWVRKMRYAHQSTWEKAGIYEAIMNSTYIIQRHENLILELASRWCSETNTFVFQWGNATLTLEDMLVLGGFSASGVSALSSLENDVNSRQIKERLEIARTEIIRSTSRAALQSKWIKKFKESESEMEHAAFLTLWLSRHVFPLTTRSKVINKQVIPVAAMLSRGIKVALGPVVLAAIYRDLGLLAQLLAHLDSSEDNVNLSAPFYLVQIWAWERFPVLKSVPNYVVDNLPRLARWSNVNIQGEKDLRSAIDSSGKEFLWCPYGSSFGRHLEAIELIGFDSFVEKYQPQLVAKQFGLDCDILNDEADKNTSQKSLQKQQRCSESTTRIEAINLLDSDSDHECGIAKNESSPDAADKIPSKSEPIQTRAAEACVDGSYNDDDDDEGNEDQLVHQSDSNVVYEASNNEAMGIPGIKQDEIEEGKEGTSRLERRANERLGGLGLDLEARISRLEDIVYAYIGCRKTLV